MVARVLHFGMDECNRLLVLRSVGYSVDLCPTVEDFHTALQKRADADAVLVTAGPVWDRRQVVTLTREHSHAQLVLFNTFYDYADVGEFDLVIPPLVHPEEWLRQIHAVIEQTHTQKVRSTAIREHSAQLIRDCEIVRQESKSERERSAAERAKTKNAIDCVEQESDPLEK